MMGRETIFAMATPPGRAGVSVMRVSGKAARNVCMDLTGQKILPEPRLATLFRLREPKTKAEIDQALVLWFPAPHSFTGEDSVEFHIHGSRAVYTHLCDVLGGLPDVRPAQAGEFTRRAVLNNKMDLTAAEGLIDLIYADTESQRRQALCQMDGALSYLYESWRQNLIKARALIEADIDFSDEGDVLQGAEAHIKVAVTGLKNVKNDIDMHLNDARRGEKIRDGVHIVLFGAPNVGKSSLLNVLARRDVAIVSEQAGTTRDLLEVHLDLGGFSVILVDTAGLHHSTNTIEQEGIRRAMHRIETADIRVAVFDGTYSTPDVLTQSQVTDQTIILINKNDQSVPNWTGTVQTKSRHVYSVSAQTEDGIETFLDALLQCVQIQLGRTDDGRPTGLLKGRIDPILTRARHRHALLEARSALEQALICVDLGQETALVAEEVRHASDAIGQITGRVHTEDMLDIVFRDFCIGK